MSTTLGSPLLQEFGHLVTERLHWEAQGIGLLRDPEFLGLRCDLRDGRLIPAASEVLSFKEATRLTSFPSMLRLAYDPDIVAADNCPVASSLCPESK